METTQISAATTFLLGGEFNINRVGYGAMRLAGAGAFGEAADRSNSIRVLQHAVAAGVNFIDTAAAYGPDLNERLIGDALHPYKKDLIIATKGGFQRPNAEQWMPDGSPSWITKNIDDSLKNLKVDHIDLWQLHRIDPNVPVEETMTAVAAAVKAGKIRHVGLSEVSVEQIEQASKVLPIVSVQNLYNLGNRKWEEVLDYTTEKGIAFIPWYPLAAAPQTLEEKIGKIAARYNATIAQIALAWLLKRAGNVLLIPGTKSLAHLDENLRAGSIELTEEDFVELSAQ
ncbi:aldo/keto reductase [Chitinophaga sp. 22321]|uniref:Aldo/keto reductase n=2 Tax=Chitinophaga hostae TaxID=2831022 RepID=A0ABS5J7N9_9BACT|nr:aldo/keto reductase [Chitinophaga hostae]MBS0031235.1 aldo/keto reductase [Chitinophaga hostae]